MPRDAIFYPDPSPAQRPATAPIPAQGQQPPRRTLHNAMAVVLASWPTGAEYQPYQRSTTAPVPAQGQQPPRYSVGPVMNAVLPSWPTGLEYQAPTRRPLTAPIPAQGQQPPVAAGQRDLDLLYPVVAQAWQPPDPQPTLPQLRYVAPLTLRYGDQPPPVCGLNDPDVFASFVSTTWIPPDPPPQRDRGYVAPLTLTYGAQPPRYSTAVLGETLAAWVPPDPPPRQRSPTVPIPAQGQQPPPLRAYQPSWPAESWPVQVPEQSAAVLTAPPPPPVQPAYVRLPGPVLDSWQPAAYPPPPGPKGVAPLTLAYGQQPPPRPADLLAVRSWAAADPFRQPAPGLIVSVDNPPRAGRGPLGTILSAWQPADPAPVARPGVAAVLPAVVVTVPFTPYPWLTLAQWQAEPPPPPRPARVAPLALVYGQRPPALPAAARAALIARAWEPVWVLPPVARDLPAVPPVSGGLVLGTLYLADAVLGGLTLDDAVTAVLVVADAVGGVLRLRDPAPIPYPPSPPTAPVVEDLFASQTWVAPAALAGPVTVGCTAGGAGGFIGAGGGGGAYAESDLTVAPGGTLAVVVGAGGGSGSAGNDTTVEGTAVVAKAGQAPADPNTGGLGGAAAACTGTVRVSGGDGSVGDGNTPGAGGAGGGPDGGAGGFSGQPGSVPGGGGSGAYVAEEGTGGDGRVRLTYRVFV